MRNLQELVVRQPGPGAFCRCPRSPASLADLGFAGPRSASQVTGTSNVPALVQERRVAVSGLLPSFAVDPSKVTCHKEVVIASRRQ